MTDRPVWFIYRPARLRVHADPVHWMGWVIIALWALAFSAVLMGGVWMTIADDRWTWLLIIPIGEPLTVALLLLAIRRFGESVERP